MLALIEQTGTLAAASDLLGVTPAAVTQRLAKAERTWGAALVVRGRRGAALTPAGAALAHHGARIDAEVNRATDLMSAYRQGLVRRLRLGTFQAAAHQLLPPAMTALRHLADDVDLSLVDLPSADALGAVAAGDIDLAVLAVWDDPLVPRDGVEVTHLMDDPMVVVFPSDHRLAREPGPVAMSSLAEESWVVIHNASAARSQFDRVTLAAGFDARLRFETDSYDVAQALVGTGYGVAMVSRLALRESPELAHREVEQADLRRRIYAATAPGPAMSDLTRAFRELLLDVARDLSAP